MGNSDGDALLIKDGLVWLSWIDGDGLLDTDGDGLLVKDGDGLLVKDGLVALGSMD